VVKVKKNIYIYSDVKARVPKYPIAGAANDAQLFRVEWEQQIYLQIAIVLKCPALPRGPHSRYV
jgi:hypothetical protein